MKARPGVRGGAAISTPGEHHVTLVVGRGHMA